MLINCPECGKEMSSEAKQCIHCGFPIQNYLKRREQEKLRQIKEENDRKLREDPNYQPKVYFIFNNIQFGFAFPLLLYFLVFVIMFSFTVAGVMKINEISIIWYSFVVFNFIISLIVVISMGIAKACVKNRVRKE